VITHTDRGPYGPSYQLYVTVLRALHVELHS
jgi:hypothetical protein